MPDPLVSAEVVRGAITARVTRVRTTPAGRAAARSREAAEIRQAADAIAERRERNSVKTAQQSDSIVDSRGSELADLQGGIRGCAFVPPPDPEPTRRRASRRPDVKPTHYRVICISMYTRDIEELEAKVAELRRRGATKASKSQLIRIALSRLDVETALAELGRQR